jgi:PS-10 peptidase S37
VADADGGQADGADAFDAGGADAGSDAGGDGQTDSDPGLPIDEALAAIEGMTVYDRGSIDEYRVFDLVFRLPVDHDEPEGQDFGLHMTLLHLSKDAPFVLVTTGYNNAIGSQQVGLTWLLEANQLSVDYRYYGESVPVPADYDFLTTQQASADFHSVVTVLRPIYTGPWISTGKSKGGMTVIHHQRFYPDDVVGTVSYVSPNLLGAPDIRYEAFFDSVGEPDCREHVRALQREILTRRDSMLPLVENAGYQYDRIGGTVVAFESAVVEAQFDFWQYSGQAGCSGLPDLAATDVSLFNDFLDAGRALALTSDSLMEHYGSWYYQAQSQLGYALAPRAHLADLLTVPVICEEGVPPDGTSPVYDPAVALDIDDWVRTQASQLMIVLGEVDPYSTGHFEVEPGLDSYLFIVPGGDHHSSLSMMTPADKATASDALTRWTGVDATLP